MVIDLEYSLIIFLMFMPNKLNNSCLLNTDINLAKTVYDHVQFNNKGSLLKYTFELL